MRHKQYMQNVRQIKKLNRALFHITYKYTSTAIAHESFCSNKAITCYTLTFDDALILRYLKIKVIRP